VLVLFMGNRKLTPVYGTEKMYPLDISAEYQQCSNAIVCTIHSKTRSSYKHRKMASWKKYHFYKYSGWV